MSVRRLAETQPESFAFTPDNLAWAENEMTKFPEGKQASAVIPLLWRAQEQEGWVSEPAIRVVAGMLDMPYIRVLEVATFYTMFHLEPVGRVAHVQLCGTTPCWLRGADALKEVCHRRIAHEQHQLSPDGSLSWEEVECLGACVNAPLVQIGADTYEDLTPETFEKVIDDMLAGREVTPGPQIDRQFGAPIGGPTTLLDAGEPASAPQPVAETSQTTMDLFGSSASADDPGKPEALAGPRGGTADDLKRISGVGPKLESLLNELGIYHYDQIAAWTEAEVAWVDDRLKFSGRIGREDWIGQARILAAGGETEFSKRADGDS